VERASACNGCFSARGESVTKAIVAG
jgi:hypothetical protein